MYVIDSSGVRPVDIAAEDVARVEMLEEDGGADSRKVLAALWCEWMRQVMSRSKATARDVSPLRPYPHQSQAVYGCKLRRITMDTIREGGLADPHDWWILSLDLAAVNPAVYEVIHPERAGWDTVVFDEAHRLTPHAEQYYRVGRMLSKSTSRTLLMTATRTKRCYGSLMHLVNP